MEDKLQTAKVHDREMAKSSDLQSSSIVTAAATGAGSQTYTPWAKCGYHNPLSSIDPPVMSWPLSYHPSGSRNS
eukprot:177992-Ditylum_brightwellii.AAC.1